MHHLRRLYTLGLLVIVAVLGLILFINVRPSSMFAIAAPATKEPKPQEPKSQEHLPHGISATLASPLAEVSGTTLLEKPRYTGQDSRGHTWTVEAETAAQGGSAARGTYILQNVVAHWQDNADAKPLALKAREGRYDQVSATVHLSGDVEADGFGLRLTAPQMDADLTTRLVMAQGGSRVVGSLGTDATRGWHLDVTAPTLTADPSRSILVLNGGVHATLTPVRP